MPKKASGKTISLEKHQEILEEILLEQQRIRTRLNWMTFFNVMRTVVFLIPIIWLMIYLPPKIVTLMDWFHEISALEPHEIMRYLLQGLSPEDLNKIIHEFDQYQ